MDNNWHIRFQETIKSLIKTEKVMTTINQNFKIGNYNVDAEAWFSGKSLVTKVYVEKTLVVDSTENASDAYKATSLTGAALKAFDEKWLRDHATAAVMSTLLALVEEAEAA